MATILTLYHLEMKFNTYAWVFHIRVAKQLNSVPYEIPMTTIKVKIAPLKLVVVLTLVSLHITLITNFDG